MPGVFHVPYPDANTVPGAAEQYLDNALARLTAPDETAAVLLEPVLGEGGVRRSPTLGELAGASPVQKVANLMAKELGVSGST